MAEAMLLILLVGLVAIAVGYLWFFAQAFAYHPLWGIGCLLVPGVSLVFLLYRPRQVFRPTLVILAGLSLVVPWLVVLSL